MKTDKSQAKYKKICDEVREEKMDWSFDEFLDQVEEKIPAEKEIGKKTLPLKKFYWMAAALALLLTTGIVLKTIDKKNIAEQDALVKNEILKQKELFNKDQEIVAVHTTDTLKTVSDSIVDDSINISSDDEVMNQILPKRGRLRKQVRPQFAENSPSKKPAENAANTDYNPNYVIINGQRIYSEQEAIDLTKYSFRILSENVTKTVAKTEAINTFNNDY